MGKKSHVNTKGSKVSNTSENSKKLSLQNRQILNKLVDELFQRSSTIPAPGKSSNIWDEHLQIQKVLQNITSIENIVKNEPNIADRKSAIDCFYVWLRKNEAQFEGVEISEFEGFNLGLKATKQFKEGASILKIPRKVMMTEEKAKSSELGEMINTDPLLQNMPHVTLALFLLLEKSNPESFWKPYIDILPQTYSTVLYFSEKELEALKPSPVFEQALKLCKCVTRQYSYFYNKIRISNSSVANRLRSIFSYDNYRWAVSTVMTRQNMIPTIDGKPTAAFIPLWDMCNHMDGKVKSCLKPQSDGQFQLALFTNENMITTDFNPMSDAGECFALRDFEAGDQIFIFYGVRCNADLFLHNGFVYANNPHDEYQLKLGLSLSDKLFADRVELLGKLGLSDNPHCALYPKSPIFSPELTAFAMIFCMDKDELTHFINSSDRGTLLCQIGETNTNLSLKKKAVNFIMMRCQLLLAVYEKCTATDVGERGDHISLITTLKSTEMDLLRKARDHAKEQLAELGSQKPVDAVSS